MWLIDMYRASREVAGVCSDLRLLYDMAVDYFKQRPSAEKEVELTERFRDCCAGYDDEPLFFFHRE